MRCLLIGNYGDANLGDEALKQAMLQAFPEVQWQVVSARPEQGELARLPIGLRSFFGFRWLKTLRAMRRADAVVFGGGSLFTDIESSRACVLWWLHVRAARWFRTPVFLAYQGIGPFRTKAGEWFARDALAATSFLSVRDEASAKRLETWKLNTKVIQTFDPVFTICTAKNSYSAKKLFIIIPRWNSTQIFIDAVREAARREHWDGIRIVLLQRHPGESAIAESFRAELRGPIDVLHVDTLPALCDAIAGASLVATQRFHGAIAALALERQCIIVPQGEGDKLAELTPLLLKNPKERSAALRHRVQAGDDALRGVLRAIPAMKA